MNELPKTGQSLSAIVGCCLFFGSVVSPANLHAQTLPDAPSALLATAAQIVSPQQPQSSSQTQPPLPPGIAAPNTQPIDILGPPPCDQVRQSLINGIPFIQSPYGTYKAGTPCKGENPLQQIVTANTVRQLTPELKGYLAIRNVADPFNLLTIVGYSGIEVAADSHSDYGPGLKGWGRLSGYGLLEDMQGEFFGTFAIPSLVGEDPRYHRLPGQPIKKRLAHALIHTIVSQHDDGRPMLNYATLLTYPIDAELSNLYVPGLSTNASSTAKRIVAGYATDPVGPIVAEFLPDVAKRIHIRFVFVQQILQQIAAGQSNNSTPTLF